jgi:hypothetical protein
MRENISSGYRSFCGIELLPQGQLVHQVICLDVVRHLAQQH